MESPKSPLPGRPSTIVAGGEIGEMVDLLARMSTSTGSESEDDAVGLGHDAEDRRNDPERTALLDRLWFRIVAEPSLLLPTLRYVLETSVAMSDEADTPERETELADIAAEIISRIRKEPNPIRARAFQGLLAEAVPELWTAAICHMAHLQSSSAAQIAAEMAATVPAAFRSMVERHWVNCIHNNVDVERASAMVGVAAVLDLLADLKGDALEGGIEETEPLVIQCLPDLLHAVAADTKDKSDVVREAAWYSLSSIVSVPEQTWIDPWELLACDMSVWDEGPVKVLEMALQTFACLSFDDKNEDEDRSTPRSSMRSTFGGRAGPLLAKLFAAATRPDTNSAIGTGVGDFLYSIAFAADGESLLELTRLLCSFLEDQAARCFPSSSPAAASSPSDSKGEEGGGGKGGVEREGVAWVRISNACILLETLLDDSELGFFEPDCRAILVSLQPWLRVGSVPDVVLTALYAASRAAIDKSDDAIDEETLTPFARHAVKYAADCNPIKSSTRDSARQLMTGYMDKCRSDPHNLLEALLEEATEDNSFRTAVAEKWSLLPGYERLIMACCDVVEFGVLHRRPAITPALQLIADVAGAISSKTLTSSSGRQIVHELLECWSILVLATRTGEEGEDVAARKDKLLGRKLLQTHAGAVKHMLQMTIALALSRSCDDDRFLGKVTNEALVLTADLLTSWEAGVAQLLFPTRKEKEQVVQLVLAAMDRSGESSSRDSERMVYAVNALRAQGGLHAELAAVASILRSRGLEM